MLSPTARFLILVLTLAVLAMPPSPAQATSPDPGSQPLGPAFIVHPLGVLQFGPTVELELPVAENVTWGPRIRWDSLGLLNHVTDIIDYDEISMTNFAAGFGFKVFMLEDGNPNCLYLGGVLEYGIGTGYDDKDTSWEFKGEWTYLAAMMNVGYRWRFGSNYLVNFGVFAGAAHTLKDEGYYTSNESNVYEYDEETYVYGMLELSLGMEF